MLYIIVAIIIILLNIGWILLYRVFKDAPKSIKEDIIDFLIWFK